MKRIFLTLLFLVLSCGVVFGAAQTYYVIESGAGAMSGKSLANAWRVSDFNSSSNWDTSENVDKIDPGDTVFFSGTITSEIKIAGDGSASGTITLDGYEAGDCNMITASDIGSVCTDSAIVSSSNTYGIRGDQGGSAGPAHYITVQDFRINGPNQGLYFPGGSSHIMLRRNYAKNNIWHSFVFPQDEGTSAYSDIYHIIVKDNKFHNAGNADGRGWATIYHTHYIYVAGNYFTNDLPLASYGREGLQIFESDNMLVENNKLENIGLSGTTEEACLNTKNRNSEVIFRFNHVDNVLGYGIKLSTGAGENYYAYGNWSHDASFGIVVPQRNGTTVQNVYIWSNLITHNDREGVGIVRFSDGTIQNVYVYNNTITKNAASTTDSHDAGFTQDTGSTNIYARNNIFFDNERYGYTELAINVIESGVLTVDHNGYWWSPTSSPASVNGVTKSNQVDDDPDFVDSDGEDYRLAATSPMINAGADVSATFYVNVSGGDSWFETNSGYSTVTLNLGDGLDPSNTNWDGIIPVVATLPRSTYGWSIGAYVFGAGSEDTTAPTPNPATWSTEPTADSTSAISMGATTGSDVSPPIEYSFVLDNMDCGVNAGTGGTSSGWQSADPTYSDLSLQTNKCYGYTAQMRDSIPNTGTASSTVSVYTWAAVPGALTLGNATDTTIDITANDVNGNPTSNPATLYAIVIGDTSPPDGDAQDQWIQSDGTYGASKHWFTDAEIDAGITVGSGATPLKPGTNYGLEAIAKNGDGVQTDYSTTAFLPTSGGYESPPTVTHVGISMSGIYIGDAP